MKGTIPYNPAVVNISTFRTPEFFKTAETVSEYISSLPLSEEQNDRLVALLIANVTEAERSGFFGAFSFLGGGVAD